MFVPALTLGLGLSQLSAEATSLAAIVPVVAVGSFRQHRSGLVDWRSAGLIGACSLVGVLVGAEIALQPARVDAAPRVRALPGDRPPCRWRCARDARCGRRHERVRLDPARVVGAESAHATALARSARRRRLPRAARALDGRARALLGRRRARPRRSRSTTPYERVLDVSDGPAWARWFGGGRLNLDQRLRRALGRRPGARRRRGDRLGGRGGRNALAHLRGARARGRALRRGPGGARRAQRRRRRAAHADGARGRDRLLRHRRDRRARRADLLGLLGLGGREPPRGLARRRADHGRRLHAPRPPGAGQGDGRRGGRPRAGRAQRWSSCATRASRSPGRTGRDVWWHELVEGKPGTRRATPVESEHPFMLAYTSGTTGRPKGAVHVHGGFLVKIASEGRYTGDLQPGDRIHWMTDIGWIMGPWLLANAHGLGLTALLYDGAPDYPDPGRIWRLAERHRLTFLGVSPTLVRALRQAGDAARRRRRPLGAAAVRLDRRALEPRAVAVALRARRRRDAADHEHLGRHRGRRLLPRLAAVPAAQALHARPAAARHGDGRLRPGGAVHCAARSASSSARSRGRA